MISISLLILFILIIVAGIYWIIRCFIESFAAIIDCECESMRCAEYSKAVIGTDDENLSVHFSNLSRSFKKLSYINSVLVIFAALGTLFGLFIFYKILSLLLISLI